MAIRDQGGVRKLIIHRLAWEVLGKKSLPDHINLDYALETTVLRDYKMLEIIHTCSLN